MSQHNLRGSVCSEGAGWSHASASGVPEQWSHIGMNSGFRTTRKYRRKDEEHLRKASRDTSVALNWQRCGKRTRCKWWFIPSKWYLVSLTPSGSGTSFRSQCLIRSIKGALDSFLCSLQTCVGVTEKWAQSPVAVQCKSTSRNSFGMAMSLLVCSHRQFLAIKILCTGAPRLIPGASREVSLHMTAAVVQK